MIDDTRGLVDAPCADCGSSLFYVGAMTRLCTLCLDRQARMASARLRDGPITPITRDTTTTEKETPSMIDDYVELMLRPATGRWSWRYWTREGEVIALGTNYASVEEALAAAERVTGRRPEEHPDFTFYRRAREHIQLRVTPTAQAVVGGSVR